MKQAYTLAIAAAVISVAGNATAAVTTIGGGGLAHSCYNAAEFGIAPRDNIKTCTLALEQQALSARDRAATLVNRGILYASLGKNGAALADYDDAVAADSNLADAYINRGTVLIAMGRFNDALDAVSTGIKMKPDHAQIAYYNRAIAEENLGNIKGAYEDLKQAVAIAPDFVAAVEDLKRFKVVDTPDGA
jgi:tetratricopeptide (TPR) repeat protein